MTSAWNVSTATGGLDAQSTAGAQTLRGSHARPTDARWLSTQEIVERRPQMVQCVEDGSLNRVSTETFRKIDREGVGKITWNSGEIRDFITQVLVHFGLHAPPEGQVYQLYSAFDRDKSGSLSLSECLRLVEAIVRAAFNIKFEARGSGPRLSATMPPASQRPSVAPPLAQLATQALPVGSGAPVLPHGRGIRLAQEWINSYQVPLLSQTRLNYTPGAPPLDITNFSMNFTHTADVNAQHLQRIKSSLENMSLLKGALQIFQHCDRERKGYLTWEHGEVYVFISKVFEQQGLVPPSQEQIRSLFQAFDSNRNGCLEPKEGLCLVDALARAIILAQSPQGYPKSPPKASSYSLAEEWLTSFQPPAMAVEVNYGGTEPVNLQLLAAHIKPVLSQNSRHRSRMVAAIESGELLKESMRLFKQCDADRNGKLTWNEGEIRRFISQVLQHYNLVVPSEEQLYEIYRHFDRDRSYSLDVRESLCLVDAVVRAMYVDGVSPTHSVGSRPSREVGSPPIRRAAMTDEELARRVAHQDAAMEKKIERLIRACSDSVALRVSTGVMHVMFSAWRQCATKDLFARAKQGWDRQCEELSAAAEKAKRRLEEEQRGFEDELERMEQRRVLDTTASLSAREAAEVAAEAEEEAIRKHLKERQLWEARMKEERQQRERLEREFRDSLQLAEAQAEERAEARFVQERQLYEERLKEERDRRVRAETAKAQALDHWAEEARKLKKNAVQQVMANWLPKNSKEQVARQLRGIAGKWLELAKAGGRRRGRLTALDKAVMSWGRKALSGRPGPSFHAWRDVIRAQRRAKAAVGVLSRQWLGGSKGLMASYMAEWRQLLAEKRQNELKAKRKARAHAQISLLVAQWERGQKAGLLSSYLDAWGGVAKEEGRKHRKGRRREAVQLALEKWTRGASKGLLHEVLRLWHKHYVSRNRHAWLMSNYLVKWEEQAEVGVAHTCYVAWKKLTDASVRKRLMEHGKESVKLAVEKFLRGNLRGLLHEVVREWYKASVERRQKVEMVKKSLVAWEEETGVGILKTCTAAWKRLVDAKVIDRNLRNGKEAVKLALEKWERGDRKGLLHEVVSEWHKVAVVRGRKAAMMSNFLVSWEMEAEVGLMQTCHAAWRRLAQAQARHEAKERGKEAVLLALAKWERGNVQGLLQEILSVWHHSSAKGQQKAKLLNRCLLAWESKAGVALRATFLAVWRQTAADASKKHAKQRGREAVQLALQKWERGNVQGLLHEIVIQWHHSSAKGQQKAKLLNRCLLAWESKAGVALRATFLAVWRQTAAAVVKDRTKKHSREAVELALQKWERGNVNGLLHETLDQWHRLAAKRRQQDVSIKRFLLAWESKTGVGLLGSFFKLWREEVDAIVKERRKKHSREAVALALQKWERGNVNGLLHETLDQWHRLAAKRRQQDVSIKRFLLAWESKTGVGLLGSFFKLWREEVDAIRKETMKKRSHEAVKLAMQKFVRGNERGLLSESLSQWKELMEKDKARAGIELMIQRWARGDTAGLLAEIFVVWKRAVDERKKSARRDRAHQAVNMLLCTWRRPGPQGVAACAISAWSRYAAKNRGRTRARLAMEQQVKRYFLSKVDAMRGVVFADWRQAARRGKAHGSVEVILKQWEMGSARGLQVAVLGEWQRFVKELKQDQKHQKAHAVVELTLSQWEKGQSKGLMATVVKDWRKYIEVTASNGRRIRGAGTLEEKLLLSLLQLCLHGWRRILDVDRATGRAEALRETLRQQREEREETENKLLLNLAMAVWQLCVIEPKKDQAFAQLTETNAIAFQLQEACQVYTQENETLQDRLKQAMDTLQRELQTKEEMAKELRDAYSKQARLSPLLPELPDGIVQNRGLFNAQAVEDIAASVASGLKRSKAGSPRRANGVETKTSEHCDWDSALPRMEQLMKSLDDDKAWSTPKEDIAGRFEELAREDQELLSRAEPVAVEPLTSRLGQSPSKSPGKSTPTSAAAARRRRLAAERAGRFDDDEWL